MVLTACTQQGLSKKFILPDDLYEASGVYYAGRDSLWWHNDGGNGPYLFLTDEKGVLKEKYRLPEGKNKDWEDITADTSGRIYIGDFGNNDNDRRDLRIYILDPRDESVKSISFEYEDQENFPPPEHRMNFDMEAFFWHHDSLHLFSKNKLGTGNFLTKHYVLPDRPGHHVAELRDSLRLGKRVVTGAAISPDGKSVALVAYRFEAFLGVIPLSSASVYILEGFPGNHFLRGQLRKRKIPKGILPVQYEAIDFIGNQQVLVASERTILFRQKARRLSIGKDNTKPLLP